MTIGFPVLFPDDIGCLQIIGTIFFKADYAVIASEWRCQIVEYRLLR